MMREIVIHTLKNTDVSVEALYELYQQSFRQWHDHQIVSPYISESLEGFKSYVEKALVFVCLDAVTEELLGMHCFFNTRKKGGAGGFFLAVSPKVKHQGIASRMLEHETVFFRQHGYRYFDGNTLAAAKWSVRWHLKNGYHIVGYSRSINSNSPSYTFRKQFAYDLRHHPTDFFWLPCIAPITARLTYAITFLVTCICKKRSGELNALGRLAKRLRR